MRILFDEIPKSGGSCIFSCYILGTKKLRYELDGFYCPDTCTYLAKGVVANELAGEEDGEEATGETFE